MSRILFLVTDLQPGGTPLRVVRWAEWLRDAGVDVVVGCLAPRGPLCDRLDRLGIPNFNAGARGRFDLTAMFRLARLIREHDPDLIHSFLFHANVAARFLGRLDRPRAIVTSTATIEIERRWHRAIETLTAGLSDLHVINTPAVARHVADDLGFDPARVVLVPSGIDLDCVDAEPPVDRAAFDLPADVPLIAWAGRMDPIKALDAWIEIVDRVRRRLDVRGVLIGDGPERGYVESELHTRGLHRVVRCVGWSDRVIGWLKTSDLLLFTSRTEGLPNVVIEAMAAGCAVVAAAVGGTQDLITSGKTGILHTADAVDAFEASVLALCRSPGLRARLGESARAEVAQTQSRSATLESLSRLYDRALPKKKL